MKENLRHLSPPKSLLITALFNLQNQINKHKVRIWDQHLNSAEQGYIVNVRKKNKRKFPQQTFRYKKVEIINDDNLEQFETPNLFKWLDILPDVCLEMDLKCLKRGKNGHVPQSMCCKANKTSQKVRVHNNQEKFDLLTDNSEEDIGILIMRGEILNTRKHSLKKCRNCNFKKRQCILDTSTCKAAQNNCFFCGKAGHFPQSLCCLKRRKPKSKETQKIRSKSYISDQFTISKRNMRLINKRIQQIESLEKRKRIWKLAKKCADKFPN